MKKIQASPQNSQKEKLYHRAMKTLEKYNQTKCWEISFQTFKDKKDKSRYRLEFRLDRQKFRAQNIIGHYYLLQTDLGGKALTAREAQQYYQKLIKAERCFRAMKSDLEVRPIRHRKEGRIRSHIYLNFLALWLAKYIEGVWQNKGIKCEVPRKLKEWDRRMMLHEILDKKNHQLIELQWNQGPIARETFQEIINFGEMTQKLPHL